jgi:tRNA nucleotidyltransferase (CCA-adding enzyme)
MFASGPDAVDDVVARLKLSGRAAQCLVTLADTVATATTAADDGRRPSERVALLEDRSSEGILLAMARLDLASRQRLARALEAGIRTGMPATGADLVATGIAPGPWIGRALRDTRWAILDGEIASDEAVGWATARAHELEKSWLR